MKTQKILYKAFTLCVMTLTLATQAQAASNRFDVSNNTLIDNSSGLVWQSLIINNGFPDDLRVSDWRVATISELMAIIPSTSGSTTLAAADTSVALDFFASRLPAGASCASSIENGACFKGFTYDESDKAYIPSFISSITPESNAKYYAHITTASAYFSNQWCSRANLDCSRTPIFTVKAIPEPSTLSLSILGIAFLLISFSKKKSQVGEAAQGH